MALEADLPSDPKALRAMLAAAQARIAALEQERDTALGDSERLYAIIAALNRRTFGRRSEKLDQDQLALGLEDLEQSLAAAEAAKERDGRSGTTRLPPRRRKTNRGALPAHLPRVETVIDIADKACPCCAGPLHPIGEDTSERLDRVPAQLQVLVTRRPKYACRACEGAVVQAPAPPRLIARCSASASSNPA